MKIVKLTAENIKRLSAVEISPAGHVIPVSGRNGAGKTSVLDSIWWALAGVKHIQAMPIRDGETKARIKLDLGEIVVERRFTPRGSYLDVSTQEGAIYKSPQKMLDDLIGALSFDPLKFSQMPGDEQAQTLRDLAGVDTSELDAKREEAYDLRRKVGREMRDLEAVVDRLAAKAPGSDPGAPRKMSELMVEHHEANSTNNEIDVLSAKSTDAVLAVERLRQRREVLEDDLQEVIQDLDVAEKFALEASEKAREGEKRRVDVSEIEARIHASEEQQTAAHAWEALLNANTALRESTEQHQCLDGNIKDIDARKAKMLDEAEFPLELLGVEEDGVTYNGVPFEQASHAEQLRVSMAIAMAMNPKLRVIRITDASLLDSDSLELVADLAKERDFQVWLEVVDTSGSVGVVIEDGAVIADNQRASTAA